MATPSRNLGTLTGANSASIADFELSITRALRDQLSERLDGLTPAVLDASALAAIEERSGIYVLHVDNERVSIGKAQRSLRQRLADHCRKLSGRRNIGVEDVTYTALYVNEDLDAVAPETLLIKDFRPTWNNNGFGNKDPGRRRDHTVVKRAHFDASFPIDLTKLTVTISDAPTLNNYLRSLKRNLPFNFRYAARPEHRRVYEGIGAPRLSEGAATEAVFEAVVYVLPPGWQLTALPGYAILYQESTSYPSAQAWWRQTPDGGVLRTNGEFRLGQGDVQSVLDESEDENE
jgi:hypothetical protein